MKKNLIVIYVLLFPMVFMGCFEDKGSYDYLDLNAPIWLFDESTSPLRVTCTEGQIAKFIASDKFRWQGDSMQRAKEVSYEWKLNGIVLSNQVDFDILADELIEKIKLEKFEENGLTGTFTIIDNNTDIRFTVRTDVTISPKYNNGDWLFISENGNNTKCSFMDYKTRYDATGHRETYFELTEDVYKVVNGHDIPGKPLAMSKSMAPNVGALGSMTIMTDEVAYVLDNTSMKKISEVKDEFMDGVPANLKIVERRDCDGRYGGYTFLATEDGLIYRRKTTENYLGGKFLSEPYVLDNKGYKITKFGFAGSGWSIVPCYDEKNRRVIMIHFGSIQIGNWWDGTYQLIQTHKLAPVTPLAGADLTNVPPLWDMPEGTEMLFLMNHELFDLHYSSNQQAYTMFYNTAEMDATYMSDFIINTIDVNCVESEYSKIMKLPVLFDSETVFLTSIFDDRCKYLLFYSDENKLYYLDRQENRNEIHYLLSVDSKITFMGFTSFYSSDQYKKIIVGCENGDICVYDIAILDEPKLVSQFNVGGRVVDGVQLGNAYAFDEIY